MRKLSCLFFLHLFLQFSFSQVAVINLRTENLVDPIGIDDPHPRFSWLLSASSRNVSQTAYEIKLSAANEINWNSGKVNSSQSVHVPYEGPVLVSGKKYTWQVRVWDHLGKVSKWSDPAYWQQGLSKQEDWKANWIESGLASDSVMGPALLFRTNFASDKKIQSATAWISAHGMYEAQINGIRVGDAYLTPGWTSYNKRIQYQGYDVTQLIKHGANAIGVTVGSGWYRTPLAWGNNKNLYGKKLALLFQLEIIFTDGTKELILSDDKWKTAEGPVRVSELYDGEIYDARLEKNGWATTAYDDQHWSPVQVKDYSKNTLISTIGQPVRKHEIFKPVKIFKTPAGEQVVDFGQNLVGWEQIKLAGKTADKIVISHAEVLDKNGNFYTENLRAAKAQNTYILNGGAEETFEPHFTFQGFRYIKIAGYSGEIKPENITAVALYSDMPVTGSFSCSNPLLNQLQHNIQWGQRGNFLDVPTDCPQRDERLGWTGDAQAFSRTAAFNMQVNNFFAKWLKDVAADQLSNGSVPFVIPNVLGVNDAGSAGWSDVATIIPWNMWLAYGDKKILEQQYPSMKAWVSYMELKSTKDLWNKGFHFGDWLYYRPDDDNDGRAAITDKYLIAQCFYAYSTQLVINAARVLGKDSEVPLYEALLARIKAAFLKEYVTASGRLVSGSQTAYVLALNFDMLPETMRTDAALRLVQNIKDYDYHLTTGFLGTPYLCHVLSRFGYKDIAYTLLMQESYPSWLYPVKMGATTIWERWDGQKPDGSFQTPNMNSFNHYAYGAIGDWMYRVIAGIDTDNGIDGVGYKKIIIKPYTSGKVVADDSVYDRKSLSQVTASLDSYYGKIVSSWKNEGDKLLLDIEIPANTTATVYIPAISVNSVKESGSAVLTAEGVKVIGMEGDTLQLNLGSGSYHFSTEKLLPKAVNANPGH